MSAPAGGEATPQTTQGEAKIGSNTCCKCPVCLCGPDCACPNGEGPGCDPCGAFTGAASTTPAGRAGDATQQQPLIRSKTCRACSVCACGPDYLCSKGSGPGCDPCAAFVEDAATAAAAAAAAATGSGAAAGEATSPTKLDEPISGSTTCCKCPVCTCGPDCACPKGEGPGCDPCAAFMEDAAAAAAATGSGAAAGEATPPTKLDEPISGSTTCCKCPVCTCGPDCACPKGEGPGCDPCAAFMKGAAAAVPAAAAAADYPSSGGGTDGESKKQNQSICIGISSSSSSTAVHSAQNMTKKRADHQQKHGKRRRGLGRRGKCKYKSNAGRDGGGSGEPNAPGLFDEWLGERLTAWKEEGGAATRAAVGGGGGGGAVLARPPEGSGVTEEIDFDLEKDEIAFPNSLSALQRRQVHGWAMQLALFHASSGEDKQRHVIVSKTGHFKGKVLTRGGRTWYKEGVVAPVVKRFALQPGHEAIAAPFVTALKSFHQEVQLREPGFEKWLKTHTPFARPTNALDSEIEKAQEAFSKWPLLHDVEWEFVDAPEKLSALVDVLESCKEFGFDLEEHNARTYHGLSCLLQISTEKKDYIVDPLAEGMWDKMALLRGPFGNADVLKIGHAMRSTDVPSLYRDFGIVVINAIDTEEAVNALGEKHTGLAKVLVNAGVRENHDLGGLKQAMQACDWRERPLSPDKLIYARCDSHYLIPLWHLLRARLVAADTCSSREEAKHKEEQREIQRGLDASQKRKEEAARQGFFAVERKLRGRSPARSGPAPAPQALVQEPRVLEWDDPNTCHKRERSRSGSFFRSGLESIHESADSVNAGLDESLAAAVSLKNDGEDGDGETAHAAGGEGGTPHLVDLGQNVLDPLDLGANFLAEVEEAKEEEEHLLDRKPQGRSPGRRSDAASPPQLLAQEPRISEWDDPKDCHKRERSRSGSLFKSGLDSIHENADVNGAGLEKALAAAFTEEDGEGEDRHEAHATGVGTESPYHGDHAGIEASFHPVEPKVRGRSPARGPGTCSPPQLLAQEPRISEWDDPKDCHKRERSRSGSFFRSDLKSIHESADPVSTGLTKALAAAFTEDDGEDEDRGQAQAAGSERDSLNRVDLGENFVNEVKEEVQCLSHTVERKVRGRSPARRSVAASTAPQLLAQEPWISEWDDPDNCHKRERSRSSSCFRTGLESINEGVDAVGAGSEKAFAAMSLPEDDGGDEDRHQAQAADSEVDVLHRVDLGENFMEQLAETEEESGDDDEDDDEDLWDGWGEATTASAEERSVSGEHEINVLGAVPSPSTALHKRRGDMTTLPDQTALVAGGDLAGSAAARKDQKSSTGSSLRDSAAATCLPLPPSATPSAAASTPASAAQKSSDLSQPPRRGGARMPAKEPEIAVLTDGVRLVWKALSRTHMATSVLWRPSPEAKRKDSHNERHFRTAVQRLRTPRWSEVNVKVYEEIFLWRDRTARRMDDGAAYVCPGDCLIDVALALPTTLDALRRVSVPLSPVLGRADTPEAAELVAVVRSALGLPTVQEEEEDKDEVGERGGTEVQKGTRREIIPN